MPGEDRDNDPIQKGERTNESITSNDLYRSGRRRFFDPESKDGFTQPIRVHCDKRSEILVLI